MQHEQSATGKNCNIQIVKNTGKETGEEYKTKTLQRVKVQHEIVQYIKRFQHEKKCNMKRLQHKKVPHGNGVVWKKCNKKRVKKEQSAIWKKKIATVKYKKSAQE